MRRAPSLALVAWLMVHAACSVDVASRVEDGTREFQPNIPRPPAPPASPAAPRLTPCPSGWREIPGPTAGDAVTCDPWPQSGLQVCALDEAHFPGTPGCSRIGAACPAGEWPEGLPTNARVLYVRAGGAAGGVGTMASPFGSVNAALLLAPIGTILALGKGTFDELVPLPGGITLWGACVAQTHLARSIGEDLPTVAVRSDGAVIRNLRIGGPNPGVLISLAGTGLLLEDVVISGAAAIGLVAINSVRVTGSRVVIRGTTPRAAVNDLGEGIEASRGAQLDLKWVSVESNRSFGIWASGSGTRVTLEDAVVRDTKNQLNTGFGGHGLEVQGEASFEGRRLVLERNQETGLYATRDAGVLILDGVVRDHVPSASATNSGSGASVHANSRLELHRVGGHPRALRTQPRGWRVCSGCPDHRH